ncbi:hypothetical protein MVEN_01042400 [Mycena venus]|uniref:Uncharacterized protein n=1 Tax=Mycena venus TaxID=2733690 RepID=A0A8H7D2X0_9AGAR|nr:hypothetical protein MVEN_01042400 [Mycena venus]
MSDGELDDLYQEVWAGFTGPTSPNGTRITSDDVPQTATLDSPMLPDEYSTFSTYSHGSLPARVMSASSMTSSSESSVIQSNGTTYTQGSVPSRALSASSVASSANSSLAAQSSGSSGGKAVRPLPRPPSPSPGAAASAPPTLPQPLPAQTLEPPPLPPKAF